MKITKKILKELLKEGITKKMIEETKGINPVQLLKDEEPVKLIKCTTGYWVKTDEGFLKTEKGELEIIKEIEAKIGRARYVLNFQEEITEREIQKEVENLIKITKEKVENYLSKIKKILLLAGVINESDFGLVLQKRIWEENGTLEAKIAEAKDIAMQEDYVFSYEKIKEMYENEDYDCLYIHFFQQGLPEIARFDLDDIEGLKKHFNLDNLHKTIGSIKSDNHLYNVAKFRVS